jgi:hypothetical protein
MSACAVVAEVFAHGAAGVGREVLHRRRVGRGGRDDDVYPWRRALRASSPPAPRWSASGRSRRRCKSRRRPSWLMMVSSAMAVLPVWRSPMISSRWPRPIGIMASMALMPVCIGSFTGCRSTTPGAMRSMGVELVVTMGPCRRWAAQRVDHAADQRLAHRHGHDAAGALDFVAFLDLRVFAQQHRAHLVFFQVHGDAGHAVRELDQFAGHDLFEAVDAGDAVAHRDHRACAIFFSVTMNFPR